LKIDAQPVGSMNGDLCGVENQEPGGGNDEFRGGSPMVMELAEEFAVMGAKRLILMTWGGAPAVEGGRHRG
jgi:hypothetical protein